MGEQRVRVMVGEGQTTRKGLLRFVLENEGYDVVAEASSTMELAQRLAIHRPDVVVLDEGIDASAVGMMREVLPSAKVILVWPRGVTAVGADARLEPAEVMTSLGATVGRVMGRGTVIAPPRPKVSPSDVVVVPEPEPPAPAAPEAPVAEPGAAAGGTEPVVVVPEVLPGVMMRPAELAAPVWTYTAPGAAGRDGTRRRLQMLVAVAVAAIASLVAIALGAVLLNSGVVAIRSLSGDVGDYRPPGTGSGTGVTTTLPGTFDGVVRVQADGSIRLRAAGDIRLRIDGLAHIVAQGDVKVRGDGVVRNVSSTKVRVRGNGTIRMTVKDGHIRLRMQGSVTAQGKGTVRISGDGRFLITHHPI